MLPTRIVVKVGTSTLTNAQGRIDRAYIADLTAQLARQRAQGRDVILVTSGAIRAGREALGSQVFGYSGVQVFGCSGVQESSSAARAEVKQTSSPKGVQAESSQTPEHPNTEHQTPNTRTPEHLNTEHRTPEYPNTLAYKQAAAAIGQGLLMHTYTEAFAWRDVTVAQVLLTRDDLSDQHRFLNAQNTLRALLELHVVPIINENDTVAVEEIKFGDNDTLAALVATLVEADLLLILSDVEGLYAQPPDREREEEKTEGETTPNKQQTTNNKQLPIPLISKIDDAIAALGGEATSGVGTGGMRTKIEAARIATRAGIRTVIARGRREQVIEDVVNGREIGTTFLPTRNAEGAFRAEAGNAPTKGAQP